MQYLLRIVRIDEVVQESLLQSIQLIGRKFGLLRGNRC